MDKAKDLKPCPARGKQTGELKEEKASRFPFRVACAACGYTTDSVTLEAVAMKLWNESKREGRLERGRGEKPRRSGARFTSTERS
jgi:hypothetical protein